VRRGVCQQIGGGLSVFGGQHRLHLGRGEFNWAFGTQSYQAQAPRSNGTKKYHAAATDIQALRPHVSATTSATRMSSKD
jgi:hypothetical protein